MDLKARNRRNRVVVTWKVALKVGPKRWHTPHSCAPTVRLLIGFVSIDPSKALADPFHVPEASWSGAVVGMGKAFDAVRRQVPRSLFQPTQCGTAAFSFSRHRLIQLAYLL